MTAASWQAIILALIVSVIAPLIVSLTTNSSRRADKAQDWARQDAVAQQAAEAAKLLLSANERVASSTAAIVSTAVATNSKLDVIHALVNSNMTAAMQDSLDSSLRELATLRELVELRRSTSGEPSMETTSAIALAEAKINELRTTLEDRKKAS